MAPHRCWPQSNEFCKSGPVAPFSTPRLPSPLLSAENLLPTLFVSKHCFPSDLDSPLPLVPECPGLAKNVRSESEPRGGVFNHWCGLTSSVHGIHKKQASSKPLSLLLLNCADNVSPPCHTQSRLFHRCDLGIRLILKIVASLYREKKQ